MGIFLTTVTGYIGLLLISLVFVIHYLRKGLDSSSTVEIDPKPTDKF